MKSQELIQKYQEAIVKCRLLEIEESNLEINLSKKTKEKEEFYSEMKTIRGQMLEVLQDEAMKK